MTDPARETGHDGEADQRGSRARGASLRRRPADLLARAPGAAAFLAVAFVAILAAWLAAYALPQPDDLLLAAEGRERGALGYARHIYATWSGRWFGHGLISAVLSQGDPTRSYPLLIGALMLFQIVALYALLRMLLGAEPSRRSALGWALCLFAILWAARPAPWETVYWFSAAVAYSLSVSLAILLLAALARPLPPDARAPLRLGHGLAVSLLAASLAGLHELIGLTSLGLLALGSAVAWRVGSRSRWLWASALACSVLGLLVVGLAPGNSLRARYFLGSRDGELALRWTLRDLHIHVRAWLLDPKLLAATLFLAVHPGLGRLRPGWIEWPGIPWRWIVPGASLATLAVVFFAGHWTAGAWLPARVVDTNYTIFAIGWFASVFVWTRHAPPAADRRSAPWRVAQSVALVTLASALLLTGNAPTAVTDLQQRAPAWHQALVERYAMARHAARGGKHHLLVPQLPPAPRLLTGVELTPAPRHWANRGFARFFGLASVRLGPKRAAR